MENFLNIEREFKYTVFLVSLILYDAVREKFVLFYNQPFQLWQLKQWNIIPTDHKRIREFKTLIQV